MARKKRKIEQSMMTQGKQDNEEREDGKKGSGEKGGIMGSDKMRVQEKVEEKMRRSQSREGADEC